MLDKSNEGRFTYDEIAEQTTDAVGYSVNGEQVRGILRRRNSIDFAKKHNGIMEVENSFLKGEIPMVEKLTSAQEAEIKRVCDENNLPYEKWNIDWAHIYDDETGKKIHTLQFVNTKLVEENQKKQEEFLKRLAKPAPKCKKPPIPTKTLAIPANFDVHIGKHCELIRTGNDYTPDKAVKQVLDGQKALFELTKPFGVSDILLPMGNDIVHVDNNSYKTASGTPQDSHGSVESQMMLASELYIRSIEEWAENYNVWLCHVHSNHDRVAGWSVSQLVASYFRNHPRVHVDQGSLTQVPLKYFIFNNALIVFSHGEIKEEKLLGTIKYEVGAAFAQVEKIYVYQGHIHHKTLSRRGVNTQKDIEKDHPGATIIKAGNGARNLMHVETVRSPSPADAWHKLNGYNNLPAVEMFMHNETGNQFARFTHFFAGS